MTFSLNFPQIRINSFTLSYEQYLKFRDGQMGLKQADSVIKYGFGNAALKGMMALLKSTGESVTAHFNHHSPYSYQAECIHIPFRSSRTSALCMGLQTEMELLKGYTGRDLQVGSCRQTVVRFHQKLCGSRLCYASMCIVVTGRYHRFPAVEVIL